MVYDAVLLSQIRGQDRNHQCNDKRRTRGLITLEPMGRSPLVIVIQRCPVELPRKLLRHSLPANNSPNAIRLLPEWLHAVQHARHGTFLLIRALEQSVGLLDLFVVIVNSRFHDGA